MPDLTSKTCLTCGDTLKGRSDKKFCDDFCRNSYNNQLKLDSNNYIRNIKNALGKNRRILQDLLPADKDTFITPKDTLLQKGFHFKYHTHVYENQEKKIYYYCYDYGYLPLKDDRYLIVKRKKKEKQQ